MLFELIERDALPEIFFVGYSMGGNLVLKMAGELAHNATPRELRGIAAVCPTIDLAACADAIALPGNLVYQVHFVRNLKARMRRKATLFPEKFDLRLMDRVRTVREFDEVITATYCGFRGASDYYAQSSALRIMGDIRVPTFVLTSQDDPFVPFASFSDATLARNPEIVLTSPQRGGHCAFISRDSGDARFWAEARLMNDCLNLVTNRATCD